MTKDYVVTLTNQSNSKWPYSVKATSEEQAVKAAKKLHHHVKGMLRTTVVNIKNDERTPAQRAEEIAAERAQNWRNSLEYRYGPILHEDMTRQMVEACVSAMYHEVYEEFIVADFDVWLKAKRREAA